MNRFVIPALAVFCVAAWPVSASVDRRTPVVEAVERVSPSVVNIGTERMVKTTYSDPLMRLRGDLMDQFFRDFFGTPPTPGYRLSHSLGSGVVVHPGGYILTNFHVIERASRIRVMLSDDSTYEGQFLAGDEVSDLALIKIEPKEPLASVAFAKDDDLMLGETVICMGNPFGLAHTVTVGVLSAKDREARYGGEVLFRDILQTDAAVNLGNSGGPLLNINGELIGINVAIYQQAQNIGFAVPIKRARALLSRWLSPRSLRKVWLGFDVVMKDDQIEIIRLDPESDAAKAGLKDGDVITAMGGDAVRDIYDFDVHLIDAPLSSQVTLTANGAEGAKSASLSLVALPKPDGAHLADRMLGIEFDTDPSAASKAAFPGGLFVKSLSENGPSAKAGLVTGMLITRINGSEINTLDDVGLALENAVHGDILKLDLVKLIPSETFILAQRSSLQVVVD